MEKKRGEEKPHLHTALFTMLITLLMLCFQRAHVAATVISLAEQWRPRIFILLNLLLLSVFFTSLHFTRSRHEHEEDTSRRKKESMRRREKIESKKQIHCNLHVKKARKISSSNAEKCCRFFCSKKNEVDDEVFCMEKVDEDLEELSEEELNRRSEAFIAMFRQQLISDSKIKSRFVDDSLSSKYAA